MENKPIIPRLIDILNRIYLEEQAFIADLSPADRSRIGLSDRWSAKDHLAHIATWWQRDVERANAALQGEPFFEYEDFNIENDRIFKAHQGRTWEEVLRLNNQSYRGLAELVQSLTEEKLAEPASWQPDRPLWAWFTGVCFNHPLMHLIQYNFERGDYSHMDHLQEVMLGVAGMFDEWPGWRGVTLYNLACFYSLAGQAERAIDLLPEAFQLRPDLVEWSQKDTDLDSLRDLPRFRALFE